MDVVPFIAPLGAMTTATHLMLHTHLPASVSHSCITTPPYTLYTPPVCARLTSHPAPSPPLAPGCFSDTVSAPPQLFPHPEHSVATMCAHNDLFQPAIAPLHLPSALPRVLEQHWFPAGGRAACRLEAGRACGHPTDGVSQTLLTAVG